MARVPENVPGELFVDERCIDCDTCTLIAPRTFAASGRGHSYVAAQPGDEAERERALMALVSCPVSAIGTSRKAPAAEVRAAARAFPTAIDPALPDVRYCGHASEDSYGASSYLVLRPGGNVLVDSPRASRPLLARIAELGGVALMFLSHRDDVADHEVFARRFGCRRVLHADDVGPGTRGVELQPRGREPVRLGDDLLFIPVPGHTRGSAALLYRDEVLFSGDHVWGHGDELAASRGVCWYDWREQKRSLARLVEHRFRWLLPGHGPWASAGSPEEMRSRVERLIARL